MGLVDISITDLPPTWQGLKDKLQVGDSRLILFIASNDPETNAPWCPDVRAALPGLQKFFGVSPIELSVLRVGDKPSWKDKGNVYRTKWDVHAIPTLVKYTRTEEGVAKEMLVEEDLLDLGRVEAFAQ